MRIAQRIQQGWSKRPNEVELKDQLIEFKDEKAKEKPRQATKQEIVLAKAAWAARMRGYGFRYNDGQRN